MESGSEALIRLEMFRPDHREIEAQHRTAKARLQARHQDIRDHSYFSHALPWQKIEITPETHLTPRCLARSSHVLIYAVDSMSSNAASEKFVIGDLELQDPSTLTGGEYVFIKQDAMALMPVCPLCLLSQAVTLSTMTRPRRLRLPFPRSASVFPVCDSLPLWLGAPLPIITRYPPAPSGRDGRDMFLSCIPTYHTRHARPTRGSGVTPFSHSYTRTGLTPFLEARCVQRAG